MPQPDTTTHPRSNVRIIDGQEIVLDREGFIKNPSRWNERVAAVLAQEAGIAAMNEKQWRVLRFIRRFYTEHGKAPLNHHIKKGTGLTMLQIQSLFPGGIAQGARRLAGLPNARGCTGGS